MSWMALTNEDKGIFENYLRTHLKKNMDREGMVNQGMAYAIENGGKRIRPMLLLATIKSFGGDMQKGYPAAAAVEMIHSYSLIHDDLPAMDDDDLRRGKPATHIAFGEAIGILAGDGLLTKAFEMITEGELSAELKLELSKMLALQAGHSGMISGQVQDIAAEEKQISLDELVYLHRKKTGALIAFAVVAGAKIVGANERQTVLLEQFAYSFGLAYQIRDDILDVTSDEETLGKPVGSDEAHGKSTYPSILGLDEAYVKLQETLDEASDLLQSVKTLNEENDSLEFDPALLETVAHAMELTPVE